VAILELFFSKLEKLGGGKLFDATDVHLAVRLRDISMDNAIFAPITHLHQAQARYKEIFDKKVRPLSEW
jgi:hypothetical protein